MPIPSVLFLFLVAGFSFLWTTGIFVTNGLGDSAVPLSEAIVFGAILLVLRLDARRRRLVSDPMLSWKSVLFLSVLLVF